LTNGTGERVRGHLTAALLEALRGAAPLHPDGGVTAAELKRYLERRVPEMADRNGQRQQVEVVSSLPTEPPARFGARLPRAQPGAAANCRIRFSAQRRGPVRLEAPTLAVLREDAVDTAPWDLRLDIGYHRLRELQARGRAAEAQRAMGRHAERVREDGIGGDTFRAMETTVLAAEAATEIEEEIRGGALSDDRLERLQKEQVLDAEMEALKRQIATGNKDGH